MKVDMLFNKESVTERRKDENSEIRQMQAFYTEDAIFGSPLGHNSVVVNLVRSNKKYQSKRDCLIFHPLPRGCPGGVMVKAMDCGIVVGEFVLQSRYYVHFRAKTLGKGMNPLISLQLWVNSRTVKQLV